MDILEKNFDFNKQQKGKGRSSHLAMRIKIFTTKQMLQILLIALVQVKASDTSDNLLIKIRQIIYS